MWGFSKSKSKSKEAPAPPAAPQLPPPAPPAAEKVKASFVSVRSDDNVTEGWLLKYSKTATGTSSSAADGPTHAWKKRYFVLRGSTLNYFSDAGSTKSKGELLIFGETQTKSGNENGQPFCVSMWDPFSLLQLACASAADMQVWLAAFARSIEMGKKALRAVMYRKAQLQDGGTKKKFFILHSEVITYHKDRTQLLNVQGLVHLDKNTDLEFNDSKLILTIQDLSANYGLSIQFKPEGSGENGNYQQWKQAILEMLERHGTTGRNGEVSRVQGGSRGPRVGDGAVESSGETIRKQGLLLMRTPTEAWAMMTFYLTDLDLLVVDLTLPEDKQTVEAFHITPNSGVFETNLGEHTFELVTPQKVLHAMPADEQEGQEWIGAIRQVISLSYLDNNDPLLQSAMLKIDDDEFLTVTIEEKRSLGITFERAGEWAIVKAAKLDSGIPIGAVLSQINSNSTILATYAATIGQLKLWTPPLSLRFRLPPCKYGYLLKESKSRRDSSKKVWKKRFFVLGNGRLCYKDSAEPEAPVKGEFPLMGSAVSLLPAQETGRFFCFRLISGVAALLMQAATERQMLEWASTLYHAISISNGGGHILNYERDRLLLSEGELNEYGQDALSPQLSAADALAQARSSIGPRTPRGEGGGGQSPTHAPGAALTTGEVSSPRDGKQAAEAKESLEVAMKNARFDHLFTLVENIEFARRYKIDTTEAVALLHRLQAQKVEAENCMLAINAAIKSKNVAEIETALKRGEELGLTRELDTSRAVCANLRLAAAEQDLMAAVAVATSESLSTLTAAIERAKSSHVGVARIVDAQAVAITLRKKKAERDDCLSNLAAAIQARSVARIESTVEEAARLGLDGDSLLAEAQLMIKAIVLESHENEVRKAVRAATTSDFLKLESALDEAAKAGLLPDSSPIFSSAADHLSELRLLGSKRTDVLRRLQHAVDMEIADDIEAILLETELPPIDVTLSMDAQIIAARTLLLQLREDERLVKFWKEAEEKAAAEEVIRARMEAESEERRRRDEEQRQQAFKSATHEVHTALEAATIHSTAPLREGCEALARLLDQVEASVPAESIKASRDLLQRAQDVLIDLVAAKGEHDECISQLSLAIGPGPVGTLEVDVIDKLQRAVSHCEQASAKFSFSLGDQLYAAQSELQRLRRKQEEAAEAARLREAEERRQEAVAQEARRASEAARRALLAEEERLRLEMEEKQRLEEAAAARVQAAHDSLHSALALVTQDPADAEPTSPLLAAAEAIDAFTGWFGLRRDVGAGAGVSLALPAGGGENYEEQFRRAIESLSEAISFAQKSELSDHDPVFARAVDALAATKRQRSAMRFSLAVSQANVDSFAFLANLVESPADRDNVDPCVYAEALQQLSKLKESRANRDKASLLLHEALESESEALLERSLSFCASVGYGSLVEAVAASTMLQGIKRSAIETEIDRALEQAFVDDFKSLEGLLARVEEQKTLGVDAGKVLLMKQKLRELQERRKAQDAAIGALSSFAEANPAPVLGHADLGPTPSPEEISALSSQATQLAKLIDAATALGLQPSSKQPPLSSSAPASVSASASASAALDVAVLSLAALHAALATKRLQMSRALARDLSGIERLRDALEGFHKAMRGGPAPASAGDAPHAPPSAAQQALVSDCNTHLNALISAKIARRSALDALDRAVADPSVDALEAALVLFDGLPLLASHSFDGDELRSLSEESVPVIRAARLELSSLRTQRASAVLSSALSAATVDEISILEGAVKQAEADGGLQGDALMQSAVDTLGRLRQLKQERLSAARAVEAAVNGGQIAPLEAAIAEAAACGLHGDFIDGAKSLLFMLRQVAADSELSAACESVAPEDTMALEAAIIKAQAVSLDEYKTEHAVQLLAKMKADRADRLIAISSLQAAVEANTSVALESALNQADALLNKNFLPRELLDFIDTARASLKGLRVAKERQRLLADIKDAMRLKVCF